jgi:alkylated DNA repair dioxygenase AlkB
MKPAPPSGFVTAPILYIPNLVIDPDASFQALYDDLAWIRHENVPRDEYFCSLAEDSYTYGSGAYARTYFPQPWHPIIESILDGLISATGYVFDLCFLNRYQNSRDHLGRHSDNDPSIVDGAIVSVSLGAERELRVFSLADSTVVEGQILAHGSAAIMLPGMQRTWEHSVPKSGFNLGPRISLTFRQSVAYQSVVAP